MFIPGAGMAGMVQAAASGHFAVDPGTGEQLMMSLGQMLDKVDTVLNDARLLDRKTPLGDLPEALAISDLNQQVAVGDPHSVVTVLEQFKLSLQQAYDAVRQGMANYAQVDAEIAENYERGLEEQKQQERFERRVTGTVTA
jgi:hypothetical protein